MPKPATRFAHRTTLCACLAIACLALPGSIGCHSGFEPRDPGPLVPGEVDRLVETLAQSNRYTSAQVGYTGGLSPEWLAWWRLSKYLDRETALKLLHHPTPSVRVWIARIVFERFPDDRESVFPLMHDKSMVETQFGCMGTASTVAHLLFGVKVNIEDLVGPHNSPR